MNKRTLQTNHWMSWCNV